MYMTLGNGLGLPVTSAMLLPQFSSNSDSNSQQTSKEVAANFVDDAPICVFPHWELSQNAIFWHTRQERTCTLYEELRS